MKKLIVLLACLSAVIFITSCHNGKAGYGGGPTITHVHAPTSGSDSIKFTADTSQLQLLIFSPLGGTNHVIVHDMTSGNNVFEGDVSSTEVPISHLIAGDSYAIICYSGSGTSTNFTNVASSYRNSGMSPSPFAGYTQYYNTGSSMGPSDGVVIILEEPE